MDTEKTCGGGRGGRRHMSELGLVALPVVGGRMIRGQ